MPQVDTVPFGSFRRALIDKVGLFDETLLTNEDYEFTRVQAGGESGGPSIRSIYFARKTLLELAAVLVWFWKWRMLRRYPDTLRWRQALRRCLLSLLEAGCSFPSFPACRIDHTGELVLYFSYSSLQGCAAAHSQAIFILGLHCNQSHITWERLVVEHDHRVSTNG
jgi:hypothetical protein